VIREAGENDSARLDRLYQIAFGRTPDKSEKEPAGLPRQAGEGRRRSARRRQEGRCTGRCQGRRRRPRKGRRPVQDPLRPQPDKFERATLLSYLDTQQAKRPRLPMTTATAPAAPRRRQGQGQPGPQRRLRGAGPRRGELQRIPLSPVSAAPRTRNTTS
jgi:hypothetical protein